MYAMRILVVEDDPDISALIVRTLQRASFDVTVCHAGDAALTVLATQPPDLLVLDDLGAEKPSEWVEETMTLIVNTRYNERRPTIFTTNYIDIPDETDLDSLKGRVGFRMHSRLHEMCDFLEYDGGDFRTVGGFDLLQGHTLIFHRIVHEGGDDADDFLLRQWCILSHEKNPSLVNL